jgi:hypothetical protein
VNIPEDSIRYFKAYSIGSHRIFHRMPWVIPKDSMGILQRDSPKVYIWYSIGSSI